MDKTYDTVLIERQESVVILKLNRPDALNALNRQLLTDLKEAVMDLAKDETIDVLVVTGEGRAFVAGADIKEMLDLSSEEAKEYQKLGADAFSAVASFPAPTIAAVNGFALGGGLELALCCDLIYCSAKARFGIPEVGLGVIPGWGGTQRLSRAIPIQIAREMLYTGKLINANEAQRVGLVLQVFELEEFIDDVLDNAKLIASKGPLALRAAKRASTQGNDTNLESALEIEGKEFIALFDTDDKKEGMQAFVEKRDPHFKRS